MTLYEIDQEILSCIDAETGELIDADRLEALHMEREQKIENVACWVKNLQADILALKAEKEAFAERQKKAEAKVERLKDWLSQALQGQKFSTTRCAVSFRYSSVVDIADESLIPREFMHEKVSYTPDKIGIKKAINNGQMVNGCALVERLNATIK